jgi:hypothetical protein
MLYLLDPKFLKIEKPSGAKFYKGLYLCDCGKPTIVLPAKVKAGSTKSCGCLKYRIKHGYSSHPLYPKYNGMRQRCCNPNSDAYKDYGGRGITICDEWLNNPESFFIWAEKNGGRKELQIDRIDNNGGYSPDNCRFVTCEINQQNKRNKKLSELDVKNIVASLNDGVPVIHLAQKYKVHELMIYAIKQKRTWKNITRKEN